jgi:hypothetical protein
MKFVNDYRFLKCPFCDFVNIHENTVIHHIRYTDDLLHEVDVDKIDKTMYVIEGLT